MGEGAEGWMDGRKNGLKERRWTKGLMNGRLDE
jgi:hypothetical protein